MAPKFEFGGKFLDSTHHAADAAALCRVEDVRYADLLQIEFVLCRASEKIYYKTLVRLGKTG